jgi:hypothetical protein
MRSHRQPPYTFALVFITLLAFGLRLYRLDVQSLWYDEGVTAIVAQYDPATLIRWTADDIQPPLYYLLVSAWGQVAGWSEWSLRFPSLFFGVLLVPLMAALSRSLTRSRGAALLAALITALHPLLLYYSQEARMYTMLTALGMVAVYCVVRSACVALSLSKGYVSVSQQRWLWIGYVLAAAAAMYTHYFAIFLLFALNLAYAIDLFRGRRTADGGRQTADGRRKTTDERRPISNIQYPISDPQSPVPSPQSLILANTALFLLFLPWLGVLITRLRVDASYWQGEFKLDEALRSVAIRFTLGETVLEREAIPWLWIFAAVTILALVGLMAGCRLHVARGKGRGASTHYELRITHYSLLITLLPLAGILLLASFTPKFNPRYVMVALPGLILLWSGGVGMRDWRLEIRDWRLEIGRGVWQVLRFGAIGVMMGGFVWAGSNWFFDPAFTKDQWREAAATVRAQRQPDEAVILVSGHAWPIWRYYAPDLDPIRLPEIEILDVDAVLDFANTANPLREGLDNADGAWIVGWQEEIVDPMGIVPLQLSRAGEETLIDAQFWGIDLRRFRAVNGSAISTAISAEPPIDHPAQVNYGDALTFLGHTVKANGDLLLFWHLNSQFAIRNSPPDLHLTAETLTAETLTADGLPYAHVADRRLSAYTYPTFRWQSGQVTVGHIPAREWAGEGAAPGNYRLRLGVYDPLGDPAGLDVIGADGAPQGKRTTVALSLPQPTLAVIGENPFSWDELAPGIFADVALDPHSAESGQPLRLEIRWWTDQPLGDLILESGWQGKDGVLVHGEEIAVAPDFPPVTWESERLMRTVYHIRPPTDLPPGEYRLILSVAGGSAINLPVTIQPSTRRFDLPVLAQPLDTTFGDLLELSGLVDRLPSQLEAGDPLPLTLVWRSLAPTDADLSVTVQLLDETGRPIRQIDEPLPGGSSLWLAGEVVTQSLTLTVPDLAGTYRLIVAVYNADEAGFPRLRLADGADALDLGEIWVR